MVVWPHSQTPVFCEGVFVMKSVQLMTVVVAVLLIGGVAQVNASYVTISDAYDVAPQATITWGGADVSGVTDMKVTDGLPGTGDFDDQTSVYFMSTSNNIIDFTWSTPQHLSNLSAYVCHGGTLNGVTDADRTSSAITFYVDQGSGLVLQGTVNTANTNDIGVFDLTKLTGDWTNVSKVRYEFTPSNNQGVRVAEVIADTTPEPSTIVLLVAGAASLLAYAWRKRH
jgi:hypothetical protein